MAAQEDIMRNSKSLRSFAQSEKKTIIKEMASSVFDTRVEFELYWFFVFLYIKKIVTFC